MIRANNFVLYLPEVFKLADEIPEIELDMPSLFKYFQEQPIDTKHKRMTDTVHKLSLVYSFDRDGVLLLVPSIDGSSQRFFPVIFRAGILRFCHYSLLTSHFLEKQTYDMIIRKFYWLHIANSVYKTVRRFQLCV